MRLVGMLSTVNQEPLANVDTMGLFICLLICLIGVPKSIHSYDVGPNYGGSACTKPTTFRRLLEDLVR